MNGITTGQLISICLALISLTFTLIFRFKDKRKKKFYYIIRNRTIIEKLSSSTDIEINYKSSKTGKLIQTDILIFNKGSKTIKYEELGSVTGMQLEFSEGTRIFDWKVIEYNNPNVNFYCTNNENVMKIQFDYFKKGNFAKLEIKSDEHKGNYPKLKGEFINEDSIVCFNSSKFKRNEFIRIFPYVLIPSLLSQFILQYFKLSSMSIFIIELVICYNMVDIIRHIINKELDNRIKDMIIE